MSVKYFYFVIAAIIFFIGNLYAPPIPANFIEITANGETTTEGVVEVCLGDKPKVKLSEGYGDEFGDIMYLLPSGGTPSSNPDWSQTGQHTVFVTKADKTDDPNLYTDTRTVFVIKVDIEYNELAEEDGEEDNTPHETNPGGFLCVNVNDNNTIDDTDNSQDGKYDKDETVEGNGTDEDLKEITLTFEPSDKDEGSVTITLPSEIKLWDTQEKDNEYKAGNQDEDYDLTFDLETESVPTTLYIEGISNSADLVDLKLEYSHEGTTCEDIVKVKVIEVDLDVDSNNDDTIDATDDLIEYDEDISGKIVCVNEGDRDGDDVLNFADGFDIDVDSMDQSGTNKSSKFTQINLELKQPIDTSKAKVKFTYSASDPADTNGSGVPATGALRIWTKDGDADRNKDSVENSGDFVPTGVEFDFTKLAMSGSSVTLYLEGIKESSSLGDQEIKIEVDPDGDGEQSTADFDCLDKLKVTVVRIGQFTLTDDADAGNYKEDADPDDTNPVDNTLFICDDTQNGNQVNLELSWSPNEDQFEGIMKWKIEQRSGGGAANWDNTSGDFSEEDVSATWTNPGTGTVNREFKITTYVDCDNSNSFTVGEPHRLLYVSFLGVDKMTLLDGEDDTRKKEDLTDSDSTPTDNTLYLGELTTGTKVDMELVWGPLVNMSTISSSFKWKIEKKGGGAATNWDNTLGTYPTVADGVYVTTAEATWTHPGSGTPDREFEITSWLDCDGDNLYDVGEPHRFLYVTILGIDELTLIDNSEMSNFKTEDEQDTSIKDEDRTLFVCQDPTGSRVNIDTTWLPSAILRSEIGDKIKWKVETDAGGAASNWSSVLGDFSSAGQYTTWTHPGSGSPNREFKFTVWLEYDNNDDLDETKEPFRQLFVTVIKTEINVDSNNDRVIIEADDDSIEENSPGMIICANDNDNDTSQPGNENDGIIDNSDNIYQQDPDYKTIELKFKPSSLQGTGKVEIKVSAENRLRIFQLVDQNYQMLVGPDNDDWTELLEYESDTINLVAEGIEGGVVDVELRYLAKPQGGSEGTIEICKDKVRITVLELEWDEQYADHDEIHIWSKEEGYHDGETQTNLHATLTPALFTVKYEQISFEKDPPDQTGKKSGVKSGTNKFQAGELIGSANVIAYVEFGENNSMRCEIEGKLIEILCDCKDMASDGGSTNETTRESIHFAIDDGGGRDFSVTQEAPTASLTTPAVIEYLPDPASEVIKDNGVIRQVKTERFLFDIVVTNAYKYTIHLYELSEIGAKDGNGFYTITGSEYSNVVIENPDELASNEKIRITESLHGVTTIKQFEFDSVDTIWTLARDYTPGTDTASTWESTETNILGNGDIEKTHLIFDDNETVLSKNVETFENFDFGKRIIKSVVDPDGENLITEYEYYEDDQETGAYSNIKNTTNPDGSWVKYEYDSSGRITKVVSPFGNSAIDDPDNQSVVVEYDYDPVGTGDDGSESPNSARTITTTTLGLETERTYNVFKTSELQSIQVTTPGVAWNDSTNLVTIRKFVSTAGQFFDRIESVEFPNGTMEIYSYAPSGTDVVITKKTGEPNGGKTDIVDGIKVVRTEDKHMKLKSEYTYDIGTNILMNSVVVTDFDDRGRALTTEYIDGTTEVRTYQGDLLLSVKDRQGILTTNEYDKLGRLEKSIVDDIENVNVFDEVGRSIESQIVGKNDTVITQSTSAYALSGDLTSSADALGYITYYETAIISGTGSIFYTTNPDGTNQIQETDISGRTTKISGTSVYPIRYEYSVVDDGGVNAQVTKEIRIREDENEDEWVETYTDMLGRTYKTKMADGSTSTSEFNSVGQLIKTVDFDGVVTLYDYNDRGEQEVVAIDMDQDDTIDYNGMDRITKTERTVLNSVIYSTDVIQTISSIWDTDNTDSSIDISTSISAIHTQQVWSQQLTGTSHSETTLDDNGVQITTLTNVDQSYSMTESEDGLLKYTTSFDSNDIQITAQTIVYDEFNRQEELIDARNGSTFFSYDDAGRITTTTSPSPDGIASGLVTSFQYDNMGRRDLVTQPDSTTVNFEYTDKGELEKTWGSRTFPVEYTYEKGRVKTMTTWKDYSGDTGEGVTTFVYTTDRGFLNEKIYDDNNKTTYTYLSSGKLSTRTWERGSGLTTTYTYNNAGDLEEVDYSDTTTDVEYTYTRDGRRKTITDNMGEREFAYTPEFQLDTETYNTGVMLGFELDYDYDSNYRKQDLTISYTTTSISINQSYGYDDTSRMTSVGDGSHSVAYTYHTNSNLIKSKTYDGASLVMETNLTFDYLNRLTTTKTTDSGSTVIANHDFTVNTANQRTRVDLDGGDYWEYSYDSLGQIIASTKYNSSDQVITGYDFDYTHDDIGNRTTQDINSTVTNFTSNLVNQYTAITGKSGLTHDEDGNMTNDGTWELTYNAENRLIQIEKSTNSGLSSTEWEKVEFSYDYMGRRYLKKAYDYVSNDWSLDSETRFVYDGWNLIAEVDGSNNLDRSYMWGLDLSGSEQGAGGVGGLIAMTDESASKTYFYAFDGNGNVVALVDASDESVDKTYEYDAFGNVVAETGSVDNAFRFSTKYQDDESGYVYYGLRYYFSDIGRWNRKDPAEERGGLNLMAFVGNDGINKVDLLGLIDILVAFDGTGNSVQGGIGTKGTTNVARLQNTYTGTSIYMRGVGSERLTRIIGGLTGAGGQRRLESAYRRLRRALRPTGGSSKNINIDVIGFSRGAALARTFTNMLDKRGDPRYFRPGRRRGRGQRGCPLPVRFLGLFDTVGSFGIPGNFRDAGIDMTIPSSTKVIRHAVALHEFRPLFPVTKVSRGINKDFAGAHSDVGGGYRNGIELSLFPLVWMANEGRAAGAPFGTFALPPLPNTRYKAHRSNVNPLRFEHPHDVEWWNLPPFARPFQVR